MPELVGLSYSASLVVTVFLIGAVGALYAILGGQNRSSRYIERYRYYRRRHSAILGLKLLGGDLVSGIDIVVRQHPKSSMPLNRVTPFGTLFTGMILDLLIGAQTNMSSSVLAASSFSEGKKGVLLSGYFKC